MTEKKISKSTQKSLKKLVVLIVFITIAQIILVSIHPLVYTDISVKAQLADSDASYAGYQIYKNVMNFTPLVYLLIAVLVFKKEIKQLLGGNKKDEKIN